MSADRCGCGALLGAIRLAIAGSRKGEETIICPACWSKLRPPDQIASKASK